MKLTSNHVIDIDTIKVKYMQQLINIIITNETAKSRTFKSS